MKKSIRRQMAVSVGIVAVVVALGGGALYLALRIALRAQFDSVLETKADALTTASEIEDGEFEIDLDVQAFAGFGSRGPGDYFEIISKGGALLQRSPSLGSIRLKGVDALPTVGSGFADMTLPEGVEGRAYWTFFTPADDIERNFTDLRIVVASDLTQLKSTLRVAASMITVFGTGGVIVILLLLRHLLQAGVKPLHSLSSEVQGIDVNRLARRLTVEDLPLELQGIAEKLNELLERLESSFSRERRFTSHAAHELRTPLAELKSMMEYGASWPGELTSAYIVDMLEAVSELESLIEKLSLLARAESGGTVLLDRIDLESSVADVIARHAAEIDRRGLKIDLAIERGEFQSDPVIWQAIVNNLVDNAVAYAPEGSLVKISASPRGFLVRNEAPHLRDEDLSQIFERFWRKVPSPSSGKHSGLGLSLVKSGVEFLGGTCHACLEGNQLRVEVVWPG